MNNKNTHILTIVTWSAVAVLLLIVLIFGINGSLFSPAFGRSRQFENYGDIQFDRNDIKAIDISWLDGKINIEGCEGDTISVSESAPNGLAQKNLMKCYSDNGRLTINYSSAKNFLFFTGINGYSKELTVKVPKSTLEQLEKLSVDAASADINISGVSAEQLDIDSSSGSTNIIDTEISRLNVDTASGCLDTENIIISDLADIETASGCVSLAGSLSEVSTDTVSGSVKISSDICPKRIDSDSVSGNVDIYIPPDSNFTYKLDNLSGTFENEFTVQEKNGITGNDVSEFSFDALSGSISINKI